MRFMSVVAIVVLPLMAAAALTSGGCCATTCTLLGYDTGLSLQITLPDYPATYRVEVEAEGALLDMSYDVAPGYASRCGDHCQVEGEGLEILDTPIGRGQINVVVRRKGSSLGPSQATVRVYRGEGLATETSIEPSYTTDEPNGRGCGKRTLAIAAIDVP